jgi:DNA-binding FadR family transcriptional regulator
MAEAMTPAALNDDPIRNFILQGIAAGALKPRQKLPTERQLSCDFSRPRSAVRKALLILEAEGHVLRHVGRGTFVTDGSPACNARGVEPDVSPAELLDARLAFEPSLVPLVTSNATTADFRRMEQVLSAAAEAATLDAYEEQDDAFHFAIATATHNNLLIRMALTFSAARRNAAWGQLKQRSGALDSTRRAEVRTEHLGIFEALRERDESLARDRLHAHVAGVRLNLLRR